MRMTHVSWLTPLLPASTCCYECLTGYDGQEWVLRCLSASVCPCRPPLGCSRSQLHLNGVPIPFTLEPVRFLGRNVHVRSTTASSKDTILFNLMKAVDRTPTTRWQKLLLFSGVVYPRLTWPLLIQEFSTTWVEKQLDSITTRYLKRWAGLSKPANTSILYLPRFLGGLNLPLLSTLHQKLRVSRQCQLLTSRDGCVRSLADHSLQAELLSVRKSFKPAVSARDILHSRPDGSVRKSFKPAVSARDILASRPDGGTKLLVEAAKVVAADDANCVHLEKLQRLKSQGQMSRCFDVGVHECGLWWYNRCQRSR